MDEERLKQAARSAAEVLAQAKLTAARASQTLDRGREAGSGAAAALSRARRAEVWAEAAIGRSREVDRAPNGNGQSSGMPADPTAPARSTRLGDDQVWRADALAWLRAARNGKGNGHGGNDSGSPARHATSGQTHPA